MADWFLPSEKKNSLSKEVMRLVKSRKWNDSDIKNALRILNGKLKQKRRFEENGVNGEDNIKVNLKELN